MLKKQLTMFLISIKKVFVTNAKKIDLITYKRVFSYFVKNAGIK